MRYRNQLCTAAPAQDGPVRDSAQANRIPLGETARPHLAPHVTTWLPGSLYKLPGYRETVAPMLYKELSQTASDCHHRVLVEHVLKDAVPHKNLLPCSTQ